MKTAKEILDGKPRIETESSGNIYREDVVLEAMWEYAEQVLKELNGKADNIISELELTNEG